MAYGDPPWCPPCLPPATFGDGHTAAAHIIAKAIRDAAQPPSRYEVREIHHGPCTPRRALIFDNAACKFFWVEIPLLTELGS